MRFACDSCAAQYQIPDEKVGPRGVRVRCKRCDNVIVIQPPVELAEPSYDTLSDPTAGADRPGGHAGDRQASVRRAALEDDEQLPDGSEATVLVDTSAIFGPGGAQAPAPAHGAAAAAAARREESGVTDAHISERQSTRAYDAEEMAVLAREKQASARGASSHELPTMDEPRPAALGPSPGGRRGGGGHASSSPSPSVSVSETLRGGEVQGPAPRPSAEAQSADWYVAINDQQVGPLTLAELESRWRAGVVTADSLVWFPAMSDWQEAGRVASLAYLTTRGAGAASVAPAPAPVASAPVYAASPVAPAPVAAPVAASAAPSSAGGGGMSSSAAPAAAALPAVSTATLTPGAGGLGIGTINGAGLSHGESGQWQPMAASALASLVEEEIAAGAPSSASVTAAPGAGALPESSAAPLPQMSVSWNDASDMTALGEARPSGGAMPAGGGAGEGRAAVRQGLAARNARMTSARKPGTSERNWPRIAIIAAGGLSAALAVVFTIYALTSPKGGPQGAATAQAPAAKPDTRIAAVLPEGSSAPAAAAAPAPSAPAAEPAAAPSGPSGASAVTGGSAPEGASAPAGASADAAAAAPAAPSAPTAAAAEPATPEEPAPKVAARTPDPEPEPAPRAASRPSASRRATPPPPPPRRTPPPPAPKASPKAARADAVEIIKARPGEYDPDADLLGDAPSPKKAAPAAAPPPATKPKKSMADDDDLFGSDESPAVKAGKGGKGAALAAAPKGGKKSSADDDFDALLDEPTVKSGGKSAPPPPPPRPAAASKPGLSREQVLGVVKSNSGQINLCVEEHKRRGGTTGAGPLKMTWFIGNDGGTQNISVAPPDYAGSYLGKCVTTAVRRWKFPEHSGDPIPVTIPFNL